jgi:hypothetical protein
MWKEKERKALWSGPLDFLGILWSLVGFPFFFPCLALMDFLAVLSENVPPICAHTFSSLPILVFPTREETVYGFPPRQMPIGHQLSRGSQLPR